MNINSRLFDRIRIKASEEAGEAAPELARCEHIGCARLGEYRAPQGRGREGRFFKFCLEHVKAYNASYNYFNGMPDEAVIAYQKDAMIGHRPTWKLGVNARASRETSKSGTADGPETLDGFGLFGAASRRREPARQEPRLGVVARKALDTLGLEETADSAAIKSRYKELVKRLHPDANGGDRSREDRLTEILKAYQQLRSTGLV